MLAQADSTTVVVPTSLTLAAILPALWQFAWPYISGFIIKYFNQGTTWLALQQGWVKRLIYIALAMVGLLVAQATGLSMLPEHPEAWTATIILDFFTALFGTFMVKLGIDTQVERGIPRPS